jgi:hypothetical protein
MMGHLGLDISEPARPPAQGGIRKPIVGDLAARAVVAWTWQVFPAKPHASHTARRLASPERPVRAPAGDWLDTNRRRYQEIEEHLGEALSLHVPADLLTVDNGAAFLTAVLATINSATIQCMPSHRNHGALVKHVKRIRDRVTQLQNMERAKEPGNVDCPQDTVAESNDGDPL